MTNRIASDLLYEFDWLVGAANKDPASSLYRKVDGDHIGLAGHSYGGQAALLAGEHLHKRIKGVFGLDPVDLPLGRRRATTLRALAFLSFSSARRQLSDALSLRRLRRRDDYGGRSRSHDV
jgi:pimeloyl-ACP methyl ester carboxylesterase